MASRKKGQKKKTGKRKRRRVLVTVLICIVCVIALVFIVRGARNYRAKVEEQRLVEEEQQREDRIAAAEPELDIDLLTINDYSRPGIEMQQIDGIVIHYTANPGTSAIANRNYFENLKDTHEAKASAHFVVGLEGEIVQCIPTAEIAYASNTRNTDTVAIECCYENEDGSFNQATYDATVDLAAWLCAREGLSANDVMRHYDITGKLCPLYYVEHPEAWTQFQEDVAERIDEILE
ncbi:MAG: N-acetylmuramoyl-L-alanine amidase [Lachnospiraceae bacterium]|nr:N-acetylmuramoyl-L-alanine amidase [Lachnospiraceae bacterium]